MTPRANCGEEVISVCDERSQTHNTTYKHLHARPNLATDLLGCHLSAIRGDNCSSRPKTEPRNDTPDIELQWVEGLASVSDSAMGITHHYTYADQRVRWYDLQDHTNAEEHHCDLYGDLSTKSFGDGKDTKCRNESCRVLKTDHDGADGGAVRVAEVMLVGLKGEDATCGSIRIGAPIAVGFERIV